MPGVTATARDGHRTWSETAGVGDLKTGEPRSERDRYRVGSITKTFVATVLLQLEAEAGLAGRHGGRVAAGRGRGQRPRRQPHHIAPTPQPHQRRLQLHGRRGVRPHPLRQGRLPRAPLRHGDTAGTGRGRHGPRAGLRAGRLLELLQHQLRPGRHGDRGGHRPPVRRRGAASRHRAAEAARHVGPGHPGRHAAAQQPRVLQAGPDGHGPDLRRHTAQPVHRRFGGRDDLQLHRPEPLLHRPAPRQAAARGAAGSR